MNNCFQEVKKNNAVVGRLSAASVARSMSSFTGRATTYSGTKPVSGAAAELRHAPATQSVGHTVKRYPSLSVPSSPPSPQKAGSTRLRAIALEIVDGLCTVAALLMLGVVAVFILAL